MSNLQKLSYEELKRELVICYYACDHDRSDDILDEMRKRKEYYEERDSE